MITVRRSWDEVAGEIAPKSEKGERTVPLVGLLRDHLSEHKVRTGRDGEAFVFGWTASAPFTATHVRTRALAAWEAANSERSTQRPKRPPLVPIGLHESATRPSR